MTRMAFGVVLFGALYRFAMGLVLSAPLAVVVAGRLGEHPRSDAVLWDSGGYWLLETARLLRGQLGAPLAGGGVALFALTFGWLLVVAALVAHVGDQKLDGIGLADAALDRFAPLTILFGATLVGQAIVVAGAAFLTSRFASPDKSGDLLRIGMAAATLGVIALTTIGHDAARVVCVHERPGAWKLINRTFEVLRHRPLTLLGAAVWRAAVAWLVLGASLVASTWLIGGGAAAVTAALALQLAALFIYVLLRTSWFRRLAQSL